LDTPVCDQGLDKFTVDTAVWVVHKLLDFKLIFGHLLYLHNAKIAPSLFVNWGLNKGVYTIFMQPK